MSGSYDDGHVMGGIEARADAAGTIEELRTENERLRGLLREADSNKPLWRDRVRAELEKTPR